MKKEYLFIAVVLILLTSCAPTELVGECLIGKVYGFWNGLWHGMIAPITFIISLFKDEVAIYAVNNNGDWYNFGFLIGVGAFASGASKSR